MAVTALVSVGLLAGCGEEEESFSNKQIVEALKLEEIDDAYAMEADPFCEVSKKLLNDASEVDDANGDEELVITSSEGNESWPLATRRRRGIPAASVSAASTSARIARSERDATIGSPSPSTCT